MLPSNQMLQGKRIVFYSDTNGYGGHEVASLRVLEWILASGAEVEVFSRDTNDRLNERIESLGKTGSMRAHRVARRRVQFHALHHTFLPNRLRNLAEQFRELDADLIFVSQGNLEISAIAALAAKKAKVPCVSYIPLVHSFVEMGNNLAWLRRLTNNYLVHKPNRWLTCSEVQASKLRSRGAQQPIDILPNPFFENRSRSRESARAILGLPNNKRFIGMSGRFNNRHKGCNVFTKALALSAPDSKVREFDILLIGCGEETDTMISELSAAGWADQIHYFDWRDDIAEIFAAYDLLAMPSFYEGLPLTIQEAIQCGVPVLASDVDGIGEYLPEKWTFSPNSATEFLARIEDYLSDPEDFLAPLDALRSRVEAENGIEPVGRVLEKAFVETLQA